MNRWFRTVVAFVLVMVFATGAAAAGVIAGPARVIDGDTIVVGDVHLRIFGIDAPETRQTCAASDGHDYFCGRVAASALAEKIAGRPVTCRPRTTDRYGRTVAVCSDADDEDLGAWLVRAGLPSPTASTRPSTSTTRTLPGVPAAACGPASSSSHRSGEGHMHTRAMSGWRPARLAEIECTQRDLNEVTAPYAKAMVRPMKWREHDMVKISAYCW